MKKLITVLLVLLSGCGQPQISRETALNEAQVKFDNFIERNGLEDVGFNGPIETSLGNAQHAFEWRTIDDPEVYVLVYIDKGGLLQLSFNDKNGILDRSKRAK